MQRKIMLHLSDPTCGIGAIKFIDLNLRKTGVTMKGVGLKIQRIKEINNICLVRGGRTRGSVQQLVDNRQEGVKSVHEFGIHGIKLLLELGLEFFNVGIGRANIKCHLLEGLLGLIGGSLQDLVTSVGHWDMGSDGMGKWVGATT